MIIVRDTREKEGWDFSIFQAELELKKLDAGDYSIKGHEHEVFIERKRSTGELAINIGKKSKQFFAELERAKNHKFKYLICEFPECRINEFPNNSGIPTKALGQVRITNTYLSFCIQKIKSYGVEIIYCHDPIDAEITVMSLLDDISQRLT